MSNELLTGLAPMNEESLRQMNPVSLAFVGDAVYGLMVREFLISGSKAPPGVLHRRSVGYVKAQAQAGAILQLKDQLSEEELAVFRRGRNANTSHIPKNADPVTYRHATGLETLFGYLYLCGRVERLREIFAEILKCCESPST